LPVADASLDVVVFNHIYEHVVDADAVAREIRRVLRPTGVAYLGLGNRLQVVEPHYRLPFLSWLPPRAADRYVAASGRAPSYYERFRTRRSLVRMFAGLHLFDYTYTVLANSVAFAAEDVVPRRLAGLPGAAWHALAPIIPTYVWIGTPGDRQPRTRMAVEPPRLIRQSIHQSIP
jgi:SAM-dependent methyltransferase